MKIKTFLLSSIGVATILLACFTLLGDSIYQTNFGLSAPPNLSATNALYDSAIKTGGNVTSSALVSGNEGQSGADISDYGYWTYMGKSLKAITFGKAGANDTTSAMSEAMYYLKISPIFIYALTSALLLSLAIAFIAWWKNRTP